MVFIRRYVVLHLKTLGLKFECPFLGLSQFSICIEYKFMNLNNFLYDLDRVLIFIILRRSVARLKCQ